MASLNTPLLRQKPCSLMSRVETHDEASVLLAQSSNLRAADCSWSYTFFTSSGCLSLFAFVTAALAGFFAIGSIVKVLSCAMMEFVGICLCCYQFRCLILVDTHCDQVHRTHPPSLAGRASSALSISEQGDYPVSAGINFWWMTSSRG